MPLRVSGANLPAAQTFGTKNGSPFSVPPTWTRYCTGDTEKTNVGNTFIAMDGSGWALGRLGNLTRPLPTGVRLTSADIERMGWQQFNPSGGNGYMYGLFRNSADANVCVWRAPVSSAAAWTNQLTLGTGTTVQAQSLAASSTHMFVGEYGDPVGGPGAGPAIWRTADGVTFTRVWQPSDGILTHRHVHAVAVDPYNPTHIYATLGESGTLIRSTSNGDSGTWSNVYVDTYMQAVQISFSPTHVWLASDSDFGAPIALDRTTLTPVIAAKNFHAWLQVPGGKPGDVFTTIAFWGAWDTVTSRYYFVAAYGTYGARQGLFYLDKLGGTINLLAPLPAGFLPGRIFFDSDGGTTKRYIHVGNIETEVLKMNKQAVTEAQGVAVIADASSSVVVTPGLTSPPGVVTVGRRTSEDVWVSARTSTTFTLSRTGTTGALSVDWRASALTQ